MSKENVKGSIIEVRNPVANLDKGKKIPSAARLKSLENKTIALWWNGKARGDVALKKLGELLEKKFGAKSLLFAQQYPHGDDVYDVVLKAGCEAAVLTTGD
jgi:hypothetical protein